MPILNEDEIRALKSGKQTQFKSKVKGTTFRDPKVIAGVRNGEMAVLMPEFGNEHDPNAVKVVLNDSGDHIGYLPKETVQVWNVQKNILAGDKYVAQVQITGLDKENRGFNLDVRRFHSPETV